MVIGYTKILLISVIIYLEERGAKAMTQSLNQYYIFYTAAMCGNFSAASRKLFISQPAVSKAILHLEEELGTSLFVRTAKGVRLTETGELLGQAVRHCLQGHSTWGGTDQKKRGAGGRKAFHRCEHHPV